LTAVAEHAVPRLDARSPHGRDKPRENRNTEAIDALPVSALASQTAGLSHGGSAHATPGVLAAGELVGAGGLADQFAGLVQLSELCARFAEPREALTPRAAVDLRWAVGPRTTPRRALVVRARLTEVQLCLAHQHARVTSALVARELVHGARASRGVARVPRQRRRTADVGQAALERASRIEEQGASPAAGRATAIRLSHRDGIVQRDLRRVLFAPPIVRRHDAALRQQEHDAEQDVAEPHRRTD
jgi:hypothetical protein